MVNHLVVCSLSILLRQFAAVLFDPSAWILDYSTLGIECLNSHHFIKSDCDLCFEPTKQVGLLLELCIDYITFFKLNVEAVVIAIDILGFIKTVICLLLLKDFIQRCKALLAVVWNLVHTLFSDQVFVGLRKVWPIDHTFLKKLDSLLSHRKTWVLLCYLLKHPHDVFVLVKLYCKRPTSSRKL